MGDSWGSNTYNMLMLQSDKYIVMWRSISWWMTFDYWEVGLKLYVVIMFNGFVWIIVCTLYYIDVLCMNVCVGKWMLLQIDIWNVFLNVLYSYDSTRLELFFVSSCTSYDLNLCYVFDSVHFIFYYIFVYTKTWCFQILYQIVYDFSDFIFYPSSYRKMNKKLSLELGGA